VGEDQKEKGQVVQAAEVTQEVVGPVGQAQEEREDLKTQDTIRVLAI
jgi:hypothetical protein